MTPNYSTHRLAQAWFEAFNNEMKKGNGFTDDRPFRKAETRLCTDLDYFSEEVDRDQAFCLFTEMIKETESDYGKLLVDTHSELRQGMRDN